MLVFNEEFLKQMRQRYNWEPRYRRHALYYIAIDAKWEGLRSEIEGWVEELPQDSRAKVIPKLHSEANFFQTYNELATGNLLKQVGFRIEYEKPICNLTPDWYVHSKADIPTFIVEVFTANQPEEKTTADRKWAYLIERIREMPVGITLSIYADNGCTVPDEHQCKKIGDKIKRKLIANNPVIGNQIILDGISFEIVDINPDRNNVLTILTANSFWVDLESLKKKIRTKIRKYKILAQCDIPLVISIVADFRTGLGFDDLETIFGREVTESVSEMSPGEITKQGLTSLDNGVRVRIHPALSAIIWISRELGIWKIKSIYNPAAVNPLLHTTFP